MKPTPGVCVLPTSPVAANRSRPRVSWILLPAALGVWLTFYWFLKPVAGFVTYDVLRRDPVDDSLHGEFPCFDGF